MSRAGAERGHPDVDRLADLDAGLLDAAADRELRAHLTGCTACRGVMEALAETRAALAELPDEPMPADIAARLEQALAAESAQRESTDSDVVTRLSRRADGERAAPHSSSRPAPHSSPHSAQRPRAWLPRAAAAAAVVLAGAGVAVAGAMGALPGSHGGGGAGGSANSSSVAGAGASAQGGAGATTPPVLASGRDYTPATLKAQVRSLLEHPVAAGGSAAGGTSPHAMHGGGKQLPQGGSVGPIRPSTAAPRVLDSASKQRACLTALARGHGGRPLVLDRATYEGKPAAIVVFAGSKPATLVVDVVGPRCGAAGPDLLVQRTVPR